MKFRSYSSGLRTRDLLLVISVKTKMLFENSGFRDSMIAFGVFLN